MIDSPRSIDASPSKDFFIEMLTRDINLVECVLDLIDNSVHSVIRSTGLDITGALVGKSRRASLSGACISITYDKSRFQIKDTCGGITVEDAKSEVFRFGKVSHETENKGLGVYGVGMKRACFKLGKKIVVESETKSDRFVVDIDVDHWRVDPEWNFEFRSCERIKQRGRKGKPGTVIGVTRLNETARQQFDLLPFQDRLVQQIGKAYALFLRRGLQITVNGIRAKEDLPEFAQSGRISVARRQLKYNDVDILLMLGVTPVSDRVPRGWYAFCNGRMVVDADKSPLTGWGDGTQWNPKFNHFLGWALFSSSNVSMLPWRTTKDGVEFESPVYQYALGQMRTLSRPVLAYLSKQYPDQVPENVPERELHQEASGVSIMRVARARDTVFEARVPQARDPKTVRIQYDRPRKDVEKIAASLGKPRLAASKVGETTFDYYLKNVCR